MNKDINSLYPDTTRFITMHKLAKLINSPNGVDRIKAKITLNSIYGIRGKK